VFVFLFSKSFGMLDYARMMKDGTMQSVFQRVCPAALRRRRSRCYAVIASLSTLFTLLQVIGQDVYMHVTQVLNEDNSTQRDIYFGQAVQSTADLLEVENAMMLGHFYHGPFVGNMAASKEVVSLSKLAMSFKAEDGRVNCELHVCRCVLIAECVFTPRSSMCVGIHGAFALVIRSGRWR
jgi:hypothetical protein